MTLRFNLTGKDRSKLAKAVARLLETEATYIKGKTHAYIIGDYTLDRDGILTGPDDRNLAADLEAQGFVPESADYSASELADAPAFEDTHADRSEATNEPAADEAPSAAEPQDRTRRIELSDPDIADRMETDKPRLTIMMPLAGWTPEKLDNLCRMVSAKEELLKAALGATELPIQIDHETEGGQIKFTWFWSENAIQGDEYQAYSHLIHLLCETAKEKKRITAKPGEMPPNPKYAMRCFLLSLGMIGKEYTASRKILLSKLEGSSSWRNGRPEMVNEAAAVEVSDSETKEAV